MHCKRIVWAEDNPSPGPLLIVEDDSAAHANAWRGRWKYEVSR